MPGNQDDFSPNFRRPPLVAYGEKRKGAVALKKLQIPAELSGVTPYPEKVKPKPKPPRPFQRSHQQPLPPLNRIPEAAAGAPGATSSAAAGPEAAAAAGAGVEHRAGAFYDPNQAGFFPPKHPSLHPIEEHLDVCGDSLPPQVHPYAWVPALDEQRARPIRPGTADIPTRTPTSLPLELFDSPEMELRRPEEWLALAEDGADGPLANSRFYNMAGEFVWAACRVLQYHAASEQYQVRWESSGRTKWVKRLNLFFDSESPLAFRFRLRQARRLRDAAEQLARYCEHVQEQPFENRSLLTPPRRQSIITRTGQHLVDAAPDVTADFLQAAQLDYEKAVKEAIVDREFLTPEGAALLRSKNVQSTKVTHPIPDKAIVDLSVFKDGCCATRPAHGAAIEFEPLSLASPTAQLAALSKASLLNSERLLAPLHAYHRDVDVGSMLLFDADLSQLSLPCSLSEFLNHQGLHLGESLDVLKGDWVLRTIYLTEDLLKQDVAGQELPEDAAALAAAPEQVGDPGPLQLDCLDVEQARVLRFVRMLSLTMASQLRTLVLSSLQECRSFWDNWKIPHGGTAEYIGFPSSLRPAEPPTEEVPDDAAPAEPAADIDCWGGDLICPIPPPLLRIALTVEDGTIQFVPSLEKVKQGLMECFYELLEATEGLDDVYVRATNPASAASLPGVKLHEDVVKIAEADIQAVLENNLKAPAALLEYFCKWQPMLDQDEEALAQEWAEAGHSIEQTEAEIQRLAAVASEVEHAAVSHTNFRLIQVDTSTAKRTIMAKARSLRAALQQVIADQWCAATLEMVTTFNELYERLNSVPDTTEAMDELEQFAAATDARMEELEEQIEQACGVYQTLHKSEYVMADEAFAQHWQMCSWPATIKETLEKARTRLAGIRNRYMEQLKADQLQLKADIEALKLEVAEFVELGSLSAVDDRVTTVLDIEQRLESMLGLVELYRNREQIFLLPAMEYPQLDGIAKQLEPYSTLWKMCSEFVGRLPEWMDGPFPEVDAEVVASEVDRWMRQSAKIGKTVTGPAKQVCQDMRKRLQDFQAHIPLITALRNPGLRDRHWDRISNACGFVVKADDSFSLSRALQLELPKFLPQIEEVSEFASKEYSLERTLDKMQGEWVGVTLDYIPWRNTGTYILKAMDDLQMLLDDQIVKTQSMRASPYIGPFQDRVRLWESKLNLTQEILDEWLNCQQGWVYLEPIFGSDDIMQQMPNEGRKFQAVDTAWRRSMAQLIKNPEVLTVTADEELLKHLIDANKLLEQVQKGLNEYLETKRLAFPRFYFLSNDELLEILSETKDPLRVQPFLKKIFEGIDRLEFQPDTKVTAMFSQEGEKVPFTWVFNPKDAGGNVEKWLIDCESDMRDTIKAMVELAFNAYATTERTHWIVDWPGQVVLCVGSMYWTKGVAEAIKVGELQAYAEQCTEELMKVVEKVRGKLTKLERKTLSALIVIDVHARDVVQQLAVEGVQNETDFEWMSQLRYYWEDGEVSVRMINAQINYGYEYLGNSSRLVITPLTDRCYRTLMGALHLDLGGAPEGPAGTGKTETTKDLAKAIAMQCVVFNCSDGLDYLAMGKFFKGLASSGAWACFDEFNRIDLEVLSVIAQQIQTMQRAKTAGLKVFEFEGTKLSLRPTFSVFITMNPGYAGRSELPDNLKALFRSVAMMVPDYALISEIMLYSSGYLEAPGLARKLVATYRLCSEQLSSQSHYDYGMRAVISVLRAAAANKQNNPDNSEDVLMLRSIRDVNAPKFLAPDIPLFEGILSDLFPGAVLPPVDYEALDNAIEANCAKTNLQAPPVFVEKTHQLYEMILVRHGLMLVGLSYGAKTAILQTLAAALGDLEEQRLMNEHRVNVVTINPKSIYMGQLYGQFDAVSHEWKDGVLAKWFRDLATDTSTDRKWVVLDGPVDAIWIENMNTVLDDNKKLCLNSGEIIAMSASMNMIFEVQDLAVASPATVSRCGMVYVEPSQMGWRPMRDSWLAVLPELMAPEQRNHIHRLTEWLVDPLLCFVRKNCREQVPSMDINLVVSLMDLMWSLLGDWKGETVTVKEKDMAKALEGLFAFAAVWSLGATIDADSRNKFSAFFVKLLAEQIDSKPDRTDVDLGPGVTIIEPGFKFSAPFPADSLVYDFRFDTGKCQWRPWLEGADTGDAIPEEMQFNDIIVQTIDTIRYSWLVNLLVDNRKHVLLTGPTGTGKTVYVQKCLASMDKSKFSNILTAFSAQTNANQIQEIIDNKLDKRRKGVFGPAFGMRCVVFVDDLNMPMPEVYGAQPPVELLRQFMDHEGWYDHSDNSFRTLSDIQMLCAMGPPGGGRNNVTPRFLRHFNAISINEFADSTYSMIYNKIMDWWQRRAKIPDDVCTRGPKIVAATIETYNTIRQELLPTPAKSHYTYNMRDLSKVFQGIQMVSDPVETGEAMTRLWVHESMRVFHDRLLNDEDRLWFMELMRAMVNKHIGLKFDKVFPPSDGADAAAAGGDFAALRQLLLCDFLVPGAEVPKYQEAGDIPKLLSVIEEYLGDYNAQNSKMDLVLFPYAAEHICRISRVIKQPLGNVLLVGVGGSGRQSLTKIAAFMAEYRLFQIEITRSYSTSEWRDDLKAVLMQAGAKAQQTAFLFSDTQLKEESFLEDINNILNTGEVPNLFAKDELMQIYEAVTPRAKKAGLALTPAALYAFFVEQCRQYLHMIICMSPVGDAFRSRLRKFPSLVNCCTINWFSEWPGDALKSVAAQFLQEVDMDSEETRGNVEDMCMVFQQTVRQLAAAFFQELGRHYYATPTSYLELIKTYKALLGNKRKQVDTMRRRYEVGLDKLLAAERDVTKMKEELIALQPQLIETGKQVEETLVVVNKETVQAEEKRKVVQAEEAVASEKAAAAKAIKDECEGELAEAMPLLEAALTALDTLSKNDITEVKAMKNPPGAVKVVMEAVCIMLSTKPKRITDPNNPSKKIDDYWEPAQKHLGDPAFLKILREFDKDNIPAEIIAKIGPYTTRPEFAPETVKKASKAAYGLCCWVRAMEAYDRVAKVVAPKKAKLAEAEGEFNELMEGLNEKKAQLKEVEDRLAALNAELEAGQAKKEQLEKDVDLCEKKLDRASKLIGGLGGEKTRWTEVAAKLATSYTSLTGDVLLSSGAIAYLGAFTAAYRERAIKQWVELCKERSIPCSESFSLQDVLGEPVKIRDWTIDGLPNDWFSIDNAIIMAQTRRWPLLIDPQGQANRWIKQMEKAHGLAVIKLTDADYLRKLENCIQFGYPVLLEDVQEELDPTLEPLLLKSLIKQGGSLCIRLGDSTIEWAADFRFYITTKLRNPHYLPEVSVKVTLLNFMITPDGLQDQLLGIVVKRERPELEEEKTKLVLQGAENARQLKEIEDKIIEVLSSSEGNILEDETAIQVISDSKALSNEIAQKQQVALKTEKKIDAARMEYRPVAQHAAVLFFNITGLANIEPMYQYSLTWFVNLFEDSIRKAEKKADVKARGRSLVQHFTYSLYCNICRSLFEKDKLPFSFSLSVSIGAEIHHSISLAEYRFLLTGGISTSDPPPNPASDWLVNKQWVEINRMNAALPAFDGFAEYFKENLAFFQSMYDSANPASLLAELPEPFASKLSSFQKLLVLRMVRPDKLTGAIHHYVLENMGTKFVEPPPFDLPASFSESTPITPLIFVLSPGSDPMASLLKFADASGIEVESVSLGQGQGIKAEKLIETCSESGGWVVLQNCHLAVSWMPRLEQICEQFNASSINPNFRIWLTSYPSNHFPVSVLQNGIKMTNEPPKGLRQNLLRSYQADPVNDPAFFEGGARPAEFKKLLFGLCFFHAFVQERLKYGPLGWNVAYQFSQPDFIISVRQLHMFMDEFPDTIPLKTLRYLTGECNYGGRVTDAKDRRTLMSILDIFYTDAIFDDEYQFSPSGLYRAPPEAPHESYLDAIRELPIAAEPEVFGLHANADIAKDQQEADLLLGALLLAQGSSSSGSSSSKEGVLMEVAADIRSRVPQAFDLEAARYKYPVDYYESMNTVLTQELVRYNRLINSVHSSLKDLQRALQGVVVMSADLEQVGNAMFDGKVPALWMKASYPSLKPLGSYVNDLVERLATLQKWIDNGPPPVFWISGFFFTHAFLTGVKQNYARKYRIPIDTVSFNYECKHSADPREAPEDGANVEGMFVEGARWDYDTMTLAESRPKVLFEHAPMIRLVPAETNQLRSFPHYLCPCYCTPERKGVLATTGHSTNFVMDLMIPSDEAQDHWIRRGVAFLLSTAD